jgi:hypothetical protein
MFSLEKGAFVNSMDDLDDVLGRTKPMPVTAWNRRGVAAVLDDPEKFVPG